MCVPSVILALNQNDSVDIIFHFLFRHQILFILYTLRRGYQSGNTSYSARFFGNSVNVSILSLIIYGWSYHSTRNVTIYALSAAALRLQLLINTMLSRCPKYFQLVSKRA